ncbi:MAG: hypothetical protein ACTSRZ_21475 [Promethearchaeota archaeon]
MNQNKYNFKKLRSKVIEEVSKESKKRIKQNPIPIEEEMNIGAFIE